MTLPLFYVEPGLLDGVVSGSALFLDGAEGRHAATVRRIAAGESVLIADGEGRLARCSVTSARTGQDARLELEVLSVEAETKQEPELVLVQALAKDGRDEQAIETATELGVDTIIPWQADRSIVRWRGDRAEKALSKWRKVVFTAAKQSRRSQIPALKEVIDSKGLSALLADQGVQALVLHEAAEVSLATALEIFGQSVASQVRQEAGTEHEARKLLIVVGPEGGISETEVEQFARGGAQVVRLGPHVLRSSSAGPAALAAIGALTGRWS